MTSPFPLIPSAVDFQMSNALALARAAKLAYREPAEVERAVIEDWGFWGCRFLDVDDVQCFVAAGRRAVVVSFRGTEADLDDWMADLNFELIDGPLNGRVHQGFYEALSNVWRQLDDLVEQLTGDGSRSVWVTGHSLGGALATLAVARWVEKNRRVAGLYTFGQPRCGNDEFSRNFDFAIRPYAFRFVNNSDLVTRTPPRVSGYRHIGTFRYFTEAGEYVEDISWWRQFLDSWQGGIQSLFRSGDIGLGDHRLDEYLRHLQTACQVNPTPAVATNHTIHTPPRRRAA